MKNFLKKLLSKRFPTLLCDHDYKLLYTRMIEAGMEKMQIYECKNCGKRKVEII